MPRKSCYLVAEKNWCKQWGSSFWKKSEMLHFLRSNTLGLLQHRITNLNLLTLAEQMQARSSLKWSGSPEICLSHYLLAGNQRLSPPPTRFLWKTIKRRIIWEGACVQRGNISIWTVETVQVRKYSWHWRIQGAVPGARPSLRVQIHSFRHTNFLKRNCLGSQRPPLTRSMPSLGNPGFATVWEVKFL